LEELQRELARPGLTIHCFPADLASDADLEALLTKVEASGESVSLLINNAGLGDHGDFENSEWSRVEAMLDVNIKALTRLTHALLPGLIRSGRGAVLNVSSIASLMPLPKMAVYAATKAYVTSFSEAIRMETRGTGISVTALCPGPVETEFFRIAERGGKEKPMATPEFFRVPAEQVVREALNGVARDHARIIPGLLVSVTMLVAALIPMFLLRLLFAAGRGGRRS
jgi:short-subunit dehydrogenase